MPDDANTPIFVATWSFGRQAVLAAWDHWEQHGDLAAACVEGTANVEADPDVPTVGIGGLPNREGLVELDAGFMRGGDLRCGSVAALRVTCPAIRVAQAVAEQTNHTMLVGQGADQFALAEGFEQIAPDQMLTDKTRGQYEAWRAGVEEGLVDGEKMVGHDTVGVLGWHGGGTVACVATSGLGYKRPGRVGDSPIVGAGLYADDEAGCVACTGVGEELYRHSVASRVIELMRAGESAAHAPALVLRQAIERDPAVTERGLAIIAIDKHGRVGDATTQTPNHQFEYHICMDGRVMTLDPTVLPIES